jgi:hypothetical protein
MTHTPFVDGQVVTAAQLNTIAGAWISYTPAWTAGSAPSIGNGQIVGRWKTIGDNLIIAQVNMITGSTTAFGGGTYFWSLPVAATATQMTFAAIGQSTFNKGSTGDTTGICRIITTSTFIVQSSAATGFGNQYAPAQPTTWTGSPICTFSAQMIYEPA